MLIKYVFPLLLSLSARFSFAISLRGTLSRVIDATKATITISKTN
jgi:hypothetical protein